MYAFHFNSISFYILNLHLFYTNLKFHIIQLKAHIIQDKHSHYKMSPHEHLVLKPTFSNNY